MARVIARSKNQKTGDFYYKNLQSVYQNLFKNYFKRILCLTYIAYVIIKKYFKNTKYTQNNLKFQI